MAIQIEKKPKGKVGRPSVKKAVVSIRLSPDVIEAFRATGEGWQARLDDTLRANLPKLAR